jgi:predicted amidohydrolase YtcJ
MWTAGAAEAGEQSDEQGRLRSGLVADFVVLDGDDDNPEVAETWIAGERVYVRD